MNRTEKRRIGAIDAGKQILEMVKRLKTVTLPALKGSAKKLKDELSEEGIKIGDLKDI